MKAITTLVFASATLAFAGTASAQFAKPEDAIKYRKSAMFMMSQHFGRVAAMASGRAPFDAKVAAENAAITESISKLPWPAYMEGTSTGETRVKPEIWKEPGKFKERNEKLQAEMSKLAAAAKSGNLDSIKASVGAVGGVCKSCHDDFRTN